MDIRTIKKLIDLVQETGIAELEIRGDKETVRIASGSPKTPKTCNNEQNQVAPSLPPKEVQEVKTSFKKHTVNSPLVGTAYLSSSPESKPFVEIGQSVKVGDVLCLVEAMKMFNRIESDKAGIIKARLIENGQPVEYNQPLFVIE